MAIGRTMAVWYEGEGILLSKFFFLCADGTGAQLASLAPTLAYWMAVHILKDAKEAISDVVNHDPHIFLAPLAVQLKPLILKPLNVLAPCGINASLPMSSLLMGSMRLSCPSTISPQCHIRDFVPPQSNTTHPHLLLSGANHHHRIQQLRLSIERHLNQHLTER